MEFVYPAIFRYNNDESYTITYPDLVGCISEGKSLVNAMHMAQAALTQWIEYMLDNKEELPKASTLESIMPENGEFVNFIRAEIKDGHAVKRTVSIPKWMDERVSESGLSLSRVLQDALMQRLS
jgi:predicted RNase H-like HicB family nuclease